MKEANKRCRDFNKNIKFVQTEVADEEGIFKTVIIIVDRDNKRSSEWPPARLDQWLELIRDNQITAENLFDFFTVDWTDCDEEEIHTNDSLNESGISLNLSAMKEAILGKVPEQMMSTIRNFVGSPFGGGNDESLLKTAIMNSPNRTPKRSESLKSRNKPSSMKHSATTATTPVQQSSPGNVDWSFLQQTDAYLHDLKKVTNKLKKLCYNYNNENQEGGINATVTNVLRSTEQIEQITSDIQTILDENGRIKSPKSVRFLNDKKN